MRDRLAIEVYDSKRPVRADGMPESPILTDPRDGEAWKAWRGGEEFTAALYWRANAISSVRLYPATPGTDGQPDKAVTDPEAAAILDQATDLLPDILLQLDITGRILITRHLDRQGEPVMWAGKAALAAVDKRTWTVRTSSTDQAVINTAKAGNVAVLAWRPDPEDPWWAHSYTKDAATLIQGFQALSKSVLATANNRAALRPAIVAPAQAHGYIFGPAGTEGVTGRQPVREIMRTLGAQLKNPDKASAAIGPYIEVDAEDGAVTTLDLGGEFDARVSVLRPLLVEAYARSSPVPTQVTLGTENSNDWSAREAYEQAKQVYLAADARLISRIVSALAAAILGRDVHAGWAFQGLETEAWRSGLAAELELTFDAPPTEDDLRAVLWTRAMDQARGYAEAWRYVETIIAAWKGEAIPEPEPVVPQQTEEPDGDDNAAPEDLTEAQTAAAHRMMMRVNGGRHVG